LQINLQKDGVAWIKYRSSRGEHDCQIKESNNWLGQSQCAYNWECKGARTCNLGNFEKNNGWCKGDSWCPDIGPLDHFNDDNEVVWNHGSPRNWDGYDNTTNKFNVNKHLPKPIDLSEPEFNQEDFNGIPGFEDYGSPMSAKNQNKPKKIV
jgi:hypothetical protein